MSKKTKSYRGNKKILGPTDIVTLTKKQAQEYKKCMLDCVYFTKNYVKIIALDENDQGSRIIPFDLWDFQENMIRLMDKNRYTIYKCPRQSGKCFFINTIVRVRNKKTGEIQEATIGDFYEEIQQTTGRKN